MSLSYSESRLIAKRYVSALFELADDKKSMTAVEGDMAGLKKLLNDNPELQDVLANPTISRAEKTAVMQDVLAKSKASELFKGFVDGLAANSRLDCLGVIFDVFEEMLTAHKGLITAEFITAGAVAKKSLGDMAGALEKSLGQKVEVKHTENPGILGGVMIKVGSSLLDYSLRGKLERLESNLSQQIING